MLAFRAAMMRFTNAIVILLMAGFFLIGGARIARCQDPTAAVDRSQASNRTKVSTALKEKTFDQIPKSQFEDFFNKYQLLIMTPQPAIKPVELPKNRNIIKANWLWPGKSGPPHDALVQLTLDMMKKVCEGEFEPAYQYNAILLIGELNEQEADPIAKQPAIPFPDAATYLLQTAQNPKAPTHLVVGSYFGLQRMAETGQLTPDASTSVNKIMMDILKTRQGAKGRSQTAQDYLRRRAIETLAGMESKAPKNLLPMLDSILKDPDESLRVRVTAAAELAKFPPAQIAKLNGADLVGSLGYLLQDGYTNELERLKGPGVAARPFAGGGGLMPAPAAAGAAAAGGATDSKRLLLWYLTSVAGALGTPPSSTGNSPGSGLRAAYVGSPNLAAADGLFKFVKDQIKEIQPAEPDAQSLASSLTKLNGMLKPRNVAKPVAGDAKPAAAVPVRPVVAPVAPRRGAAESTVGAAN